MNFSRFAVSAIVSSVLFAGAASAKTIYVATSGNDANNGAISTPYRSINKASQVALPGDIVMVRGGIYASTVGISSKGTAAARITFQSYPGEKATIDGSTTAAATDLFTLYKAEYVDIVGFEVRNATRIGMNVYSSKSIRIRNNDTHHNTRNGIYVGASALGISTDIVIDGNQIHDNVLENQNHIMVNGGWAGALALSKTNGGAITNNKVYRNFGEGMGTGLANNILIEGNEISDSYSGYIYIDNSRYITINKNLVYNTGDTNYYRVGHPGPGIGVANESWTASNPSGDLTITNNIVINTRWGFYYGSFESGGGLKNTIIANNTFYRSTDAMMRIALDAHAGSVVTNNIFYQVGNAMTQVAGAGVAYKNNLWYGGTPEVLASGSGDLYGDPQFVNAGGFKAADYKLKALSPALHTAAETAAPKVDFFGATRTPTFDIGAHELSVELGSSAPATVAPDAPTAVQATATSSTTVSLTWTASASTSISTYKVYRDNAFVANVTGTSYTDGGRNAGTQYRYEVYAYDMIGNPSAASNAAIVATPAAADTVKPTMPTSLKAGTITTTSIALSWTGSTDNVAVTGYHIYRDGAYVATVSTKTYTATGLTAGRTYSFQVVAVDAAGNRSAASSTITAATTASTTGGSKRRAVR
jgi:chitodextrinase